MKGFISIVLVVVLCTEGALSSCPVGAEDYQGRCLIAGKNAVKFSHAYNYCIALGCKLAIPTAELKTTLQGFGNTRGVSSNVYFGVMDSLSEGVFVEAPTGTEFTDTNWLDNKPTGSSSKNCLRIPSLSNWKMEDVSCSGTNKFICDCGDS